MPNSSPVSASKTLKWSSAAGPMVAWAQCVVCARVRTTMGSPPFVSALSCRRASTPGSSTGNCSCASSPRSRVASLRSLPGTRRTGCLHGGRPPLFGGGWRGDARPEWCAARRLAAIIVIESADLRQQDIVGSPGALSCCWRAAPVDGAVGGTASRNYVVETTTGRFFLRRRNPRYAAEEAVAFDHLLMDHLAAHGVPVFTALGVDDLAGQRWLRLGPAEVVELYPWCSGQPFDRSNAAQLASAGHALGRFHAATRHFDGPPGKAWPRYDAPSAILAGLQMAASWPLNATQRDSLAYLHQQAHELADRIARYSIPGSPGYGDPRRLPSRQCALSGRSCRGIFDLDWSTRQPRLRDLADGVLFFAARRATAIQGDDITSLTQTPWLDVPRAHIFLQAYAAAVEWPLEPEEIAALSQFIRARWLFCRVDGMRKVPENERLSFLLSGVADPLQWLAAHAPELTSLLASPFLPRDHLYGGLS